MKKLLTLCLLTASISASAQTNQRTQTIPNMPAQFLIPLTQQQVLAMDSAINISASWTDSKQNTQLYFQKFAPFYEAIRRQMIVDTAKIKKP